MIAEHCNGTVLAMIVANKCLGTAKKAPIGWIVKSAKSHPWISESKIGTLAGRPTNLKLAEEGLASQDALAAKGNDRGKGSAVEVVSARLREG